MCFTPLSSPPSASKVTIEKITTFSTLVVTRWLKEREEAAEYVAARARGEVVEEPSDLEKVRSVVPVQRVSC